MHSVEPIPYVPSRDASTVAHVAAMSCAIAHTHEATIQTARRIAFFIRMSFNVVSRQTHRYTPPRRILTAKSKDTKRPWQLEDISRVRDYKLPDRPRAVVCSKEELNPESPVQ